MALVLEAETQFFGGIILAAAQKTAPKPLEIYLVGLGSDLGAAERAIRQCYGYCLSAGIEATVFIGVPARPASSSVYSSVGGMVHGLETTPIEPLECPILDLPPAQNEPHRAHEAEVVAVGGTFDHFHAGHKLLLTLAGLWCRSRLIVGITGPALLKNKKFAAALDSFDKRRDRVAAFVAALFPDLQFDPHQINDLYGPTGSVAAIDALTVSQETASGGAAINELRRSKGWNPLKVFEVGLIETLDGTDKVSSTQLREAELSAASSADKV